MLLKDFYTIQSQENQEGVITSIIELNPTHKIYQGHFPHQPVLPGVCMMQMVAELTQKGLNLTQELQIKKSSQAKFLIPIIPDKNPRLTMTIKINKKEASDIKVTASISEGKQIFFKFKGVVG